MDTLRQLFSLLTPRERRNLYLLFGAVLVMAVLEVLSVAAIMPFLSVAANPESVHQDAYLRWAYETFGFSDTHSFLIALGLLALIALVVSNAFIVFVLWLQYRYVWNRNHSISKRLLHRYLQRPYEYFLTRNSADLSKNILEEAREVSTKMLLPALRGFAKGIVALCIVGFLIFIDPLVALIVAVVLGGAYGSIYVAVRKKLSDIGSKRVRANRDRYQSVSEALGGVKEIKLRGKEDVFLNYYSRPSKRYTRYQALSQVMNQAPRYVLEAVAFGGIILIAVYLIAVQGNIRQVIPMLGLYAFAGYRLMPALQRAFGGMAQARFNKAALEALHRDVYEQSSQEERSVRFNGESAVGSCKEQMEVKEGLVMDNVTFTYPGAQQPSIRRLSLEIPARSTVGLVGKTGSGKTTAVDLMLGLLCPQQGDIRIDGSLLVGGNLRAWQHMVGYIPQHIYLADDTVARNVAFGVPADEIDVTAVEEALQRAQIHDFVMKELPGGMQTVVGERGVKLSGGQRQRIGIARALYHRPSVIFFDEATSALDQATEQAVMDAVYALGQTRTVVLISHRLSTVRRADNIFVLQHGELTGADTYENLATKNKAFQDMALSTSGG